MSWLSMGAATRPLPLHRAAVHRLLGWARVEYRCFKIFRTDLASYEAPPPALAPGYAAVRVTRAEVEVAKHPGIAEQAGFGGRDALGFAIVRDGDIVSVSWAWYGARYRDERNFWPLGPRDAKMVQTFTTPAERGRGLTPVLMHCFARELKSLGFERIYTRIWWNDRSSIRVAEKMRRTHVATVFELQLLGRRALRFVHRAGPPGSR